MLSLIIIGLSLSIDAFSLSLAYGTLNIAKKRIIVTSLLVGIFHFIMPFIGNIIGNKLTNYFNIKSKSILLIVLIMILIEIIRSFKENKTEYNLSILSSIIFAFLVSIDSFSIGLGINYITKNVPLSCTIFFIMSFSFTYIGFTTGKYISTKNEIESKKIVILLLFTLIVYYLCKG